MYFFFCFFFFFFFFWENDGWSAAIHHSTCEFVRMTDYRGKFIEGAASSSMVNRRSDGFGILTDHIDELGRTFARTRGIIRSL